MGEEVAAATNECDVDISRVHREDRPSLVWLWWEKKLWVKEYIHFIHSFQFLHHTFIIYLLNPRPYARLEKNHRWGKEHWNGGEKLLQTQDSLNELKSGLSHAFSVLPLLSNLAGGRGIHTHTVHTQRKSRLRKLVSACHPAKPEEFSLFITTDLNSRQNGKVLQPIHYEGGPLPWRKLFLQPTYEEQMCGLVHGWWLGIYLPIDNYETTIK